MVIHRKEALWSNNRRNVSHSKIKELDIFYEIKMAITTTILTKKTGRRVRAVSATACGSARRTRRSRWTPPPTISTICIITGAFMLYWKFCLPLHWNNKLWIGHLEKCGKKRRDFEKIEYVKFRSSSKNVWNSILQYSYLYFLQ